MHKTNPPWMTSGREMNKIHDNLFMKTIGVSILYACSNASFVVYFSNRTKNYQSSTIEYSVVYHDKRIVAYFINQSTTRNRHQDNWKKNCSKSTERTRNNIEYLNF